MKLSCAAKVLFLVSLAVALAAVISDLSEAEGGSCGDDAVWTYDSGILTITGEGAMYDNCAPWASLKDEIVEVEIGEGITSIGESCFTGTAMVHLTLPDSLTFIGESAFDRCASLEAVVLPSSLNYIGSKAFYYCSNLHEIRFGDRGPSTIPQLCFTGCGQTSSESISLEIPPGVESIGTHAFGSGNISSLKVSGDLKVLGQGAFYGCPIEGDLELPGVTHIGNDCFNKTKLESVTFSDNLRNVGSFAFMYSSVGGCLVIPRFVESVGMWCFYGCGIEDLLILSEDIEIGATAFTNCALLETAELYCRKLGSSVFGNDVSLREVVFYNTSQIGSGCFSGCSSLDRIVLSEEMRKIGSGCFTGTSLTEVVIPAENAYFSTDGRSLLFNGGTELVTYYRGIGDPSYSIPDSVSTIWDDAMTKLEKMEHLEFGASVTSSNACYECFEGCDALSYIDVSESNKSMTSLNGVVYSKDKTVLIYAPPAIEKHSIDSHTVDVKTKAFYNCTKLKFIRFPAYLEQIGNSAFCGCTALTSINLQSVTSISAMAFSGCSSVSKIIITETRDISYGKDCFDLGKESVVIGSTYEDGFLDKYLGKTVPRYVGMEIDTRSDIEKVKDNTPLVAGSILAASALLIVIEMVVRRRR